MDKYIPSKQSIPHAKELILKRIKLEENCIEKPFDTGEIYALQKAVLVMDAYEQGYLVERKKGEWIPVTERLPEEPGFYIVYTDSSYNPIRMLRYGMAAPVAFRNGNNWYDEKGQHIYSWLVKYWMPLPEPPKEET